MLKNESNFSLIALSLLGLTLMLWVVISALRLNYGFSVILCCMGVFLFLWLEEGLKLLTFNQTNTANPKPSSDTIHVNHVFS